MQVFLVDNSIHSVVACANYYGLFSLDEIEAESKVSVTPTLDRLSSFHTILAPPCCTPPYP